MAETEPPLSYSSVRAYLECPLRWKFLYVDGLKEAPKGYFSFGRTVHDVLEQLLRPLAQGTDGAGGEAAGRRSQTTLDAWPAGAGDAPTIMSLPELLDAYRRAWVSEGYTSADEEERYRKLGGEILTAFWKSLASAPPRPVAVEQHLATTWDGIRIHGYVDRIDRTPRGGLEVVDYKTTRELSEADARESDQLGLYQVLVERNYPEPVESLTLYHLRQLRPLTVSAKPKIELEALYDRVSLARDGMRSRAFEPSPGRQCARCEFQSRCPEFRTVPDADRHRLSELVDRFAALRAEERGIDRELRRTAEELHAAAERLGVNKIPGSERIAHRRSEPTWVYPTEWLQALLSENGLEGRVDPQDASAGGRLLKDHQVPVEVRARLGGAGGKRLRWYWEIDEPPAP